MCVKTDYRWLNKWASEIEEKNVLELGCGRGIDTAILSGLSCAVVACDICLSEKPAGNAAGVKLDHGKALPFKNNVFEVVVASLCLHYFEDIVTLDIIKEIGRLLTPGGLLLARFNSVNDKNYGAVGYPERGNGLFDVNGRSKRFYSGADVENLFSGKWEIAYLQERNIDRFEKNKVVWEVAARKGDYCETTGRR